MRLAFLIPAPPQAAHATFAASAPAAAAVRHGCSYAAASGRLPTVLLQLPPCRLAAAHFPQHRAK